MKKLLILLLFLPFICQSQVFLKPSIGQISLPQNANPICNIPTYTGSFNTTGLQAGDTCFDFMLFSLTGDTLLLSNELAAGLPILLVNGNYTCPVFRNKVNMINQVASTYNNLIKVFVVYTVEAHPTTVSPYFGFVNTGQANTNAGILYAQPTTYQERKNIVTDMLQNMTINAPVYLDGPCNEWWATYGPAPNNAYLIKPNGTIFAKHPWFDKNPIDYILCDIDSLLYNNPCQPNTGNGNFSIHQIDTLVQGVAGSVLYGFTDLINTTNNPISVMAMKLQKNYPATWQTAFCADVCYPPSEDTILFSIPANDTMHFSIDFFTDAIPDSGNIRIGFRNMNNSSNGYTIRVFAKTNGPSNIKETSPPTFSLYPNPSSQFIYLNIPSDELTIYDAQGKIIPNLVSDKILNGQNEIQISHLAIGTYFIGNNKIGFKPFYKN